MTHYCENPHCENEATHHVRVAVDKPGDQRRHLCPACEEVFTWGVQHGRMAAEQMAARKLREQAKEKGRIIVALRKTLRQTRKDIRAAMAGVWNGSEEGWNYVIAWIDKAIRESQPPKEKVRP